MTCASELLQAPHTKPVIYTSETSSRVYIWAYITHRNLCASNI